jgi:hypothetical protein
MWAPPMPPSEAPRGIRVLVCGGRNYDNRDHIHNTLCDIDTERGPIACVIHGAATGADHEGMIWAQMMATARPFMRHVPFKADWDNINVPGAVIKYRRNGRPYNAAAGPMRNARMIKEGRPDLVVAFPGGNGTADMVCRARAAGIEVIEVSEATPKLAGRGGHG